MSNSRFVATTVAAVLLTVPSLANKVATAPNCTINIPGTDTSLKIYGSVRVDMAHNFNGDHYFKDSLLDSRTDGECPYKLDGPTHANKMNIEKFRFGFNAVTPSDKFGNVTTKLEFEGDGAYETLKTVLKLRQATIGFGNWLIGRAESTFIDSNASPEVLSPSALVGQPNLNISNFNLIRYTVPINEHISLATSLEDGSSRPNITTNEKGRKDAENYTHNSRLPNIVGALTYHNSWGHVGIRALEQSWSVMSKDCDKPSHTRQVFVTQLSGAVNLGEDRFVATVYVGKGMGDYGTGSTSESQIMPNEKRSGSVDCNQYKVVLNNQTGWQFGYTHKWNDKVRSNIASSYVNTIKHDFEPYLKRSQDNIVNTIFSVTKNVEVGIEYLAQKAKINKNCADQKASNGKLLTQNHLFSNRISATMTAKF